MSFFFTTKLLAATVVALLVYIIVFERRHRNSEAVSFPAEQLLNLMYLDASDSAGFVKHCGQDWSNIFNNWERVQRRAMNGSSDTKAVVWKCDHGLLCGGFGDRLRGILTSFMLALVTGRAFFIDNEIPVPLRHFFHVANPSLHWTFQESLLEGRTVLRENFMDSVPSIGDYATSNLSQYDAYDFVIQANNFWQPFHILRNPGLPHQARKYRQYDEHVLAGCMLNYLLVPAGDVQATLQQVRQMVASHGHKLLAVQIRTGDSQHKNATVLRDFTELFRTCVEKLGHLSSASYQIFLTTDSNEALLAFKEAFPSLLTFAGEISHVDGPFGPSDDFDAAFRKVVLDHLLISQADELLISRSGFSEYAAVRGFKPYYMPADCIAGRPISHFQMPITGPSPIWHGEIHSLDEMLHVTG